MDEDAAAPAGGLGFPVLIGISIGFTVVALLAASVAVVSTASQQAVRTDLAAESSSRSDAIVAETASAVVARDAASGKLAAVRLDMDATVTGPIGVLNAEGAEKACAAATKDAAAGDVEQVRAALAADAPVRFPVLNEVPSWQSRLDTATWAARSEECAGQARAKAAADRKRRQEADDKWACLPSNAEDGACSRVYDPDHKLRNGGSDSSQCIHNGKQYCWD